MALPIAEPAKGRPHAARGSSAAGEQRRDGEQDEAVKEDEEANAQDEDKEQRDDKKKESFKISKKTIFIGGGVLGALLVWACQRPKVGKAPAGH